MHTVRADLLPCLERDPAPSAQNLFLLLDQNVFGDTPRCTQSVDRTEAALRTFTLQNAKRAENASLLYSLADEN